jgi:hypothetical protein
LTLTAWLALTVRGSTADLHEQTVQAFERYVRLTERRLDEEAVGTLPFLWVDGLADARRREALRWLQSGQVVVSRLETRSGGQPIGISGGMCHHWVGTVFVPNVALDSVVRLMQGYDQYSDVYSPAVRRSRVLARDGDHFMVSLQLFMKKVIGVVLDTESDVQYRRLSPSRTQVRSVSVRIAEVESTGSGKDTEQPVGHDDGFLWRFNNYCALEARDGGTYVQCETVSLSRTTPIGLGWLIDPFVASVPRESLEFTLNALRRALTNPR